MIIQPSTNTLRVFVPTWRENDQADPSDQIRFHYRAVTVSIKDDLMPQEFSYAMGENGQMTPVMKFKIDQKKCLDKLVTKIENLGYIDEKGTTVYITTVGQLWSAPSEMVSALIDEVFAFLNSLVTARIDEKN